jgi:uncharacterized membrane protein YhhN
MVPAVILTAACAALVVATIVLEHLGAERAPLRVASLAAKTLASACFIAIALVRPEGDPVWRSLVLSGLTLGLLGDVALGWPSRSRRAFLVGLVAFLLGHVLYVAAFAHVAPAAGWLQPVAAAPVAVSAVVFAWLRPHAGAMLGPVVAYVLVITAMVVGALAAMPALGERAATVVLTGSVLFYASDLFVARNRFVTPGLVNRAVGLPLYYGGQLLLAWSVGLV